ncbi:HIT family protein [Azonexus sp.]|jgi:diadenosine tetraphosphate (Ap4A) HIT family hydrolase|uniref:HIT family protein n=1 Tax=Azonexus sp. TaxID=1872668 RepID=UPI0028232478|nr:HIT family protein [Azonexus sp.]MDR1995487.1 HIT family protein [Azonexus sp.]
MPGRVEVSRAEANCELCSHPGGAVLWQSAECRVVRVAEPHYPGFCRVVWNAHVREMGDLPPVQRRGLMEVVFAVEAVVRELFAPDKINLASLGNVVPHLHWHVIPRWVGDRHFPEPIWGQVHNEQAMARPPVGDDVLAQALQRVLGSVPEVSL